MAKKLPPDPNPAFDDFDPDRELGDEIVVPDDALEGTTRLDPSPADDDLPPIEVASDDDLIDAAEVDDVLDEAVADDDLLVEDRSGDDSVEVSSTLEASDDLIVEDGWTGSSASTLDGDLSPHETETVAEMPALEQDPFSTDFDDGDFGGGGEGGDGGGDGGDDLVGAGVEADGGLAPEDESPYIEEEIPKPATHWFTYTLIGLNLVATLVAPYLIVLTLQKRQQYTYAVFRHDLAMLGLPTDEEEKTITAARAMLPGYRVSAEEIKRHVDARIGGQSDRIEGFDEPIFRRVPPSMLTKDILKEHFKDSYIEAPEPIATVEAEVKRVQKALVGDIEKAAQDTLAALPNDDAKRTRIDRLLRPLAMDVHQSEALDKTIREAKGAALDKLYLEAAQRRMAFDFLLPLELFRPGDAKTPDRLFVERIGDLPKLPLAKVLERVDERIASTIDKNYKPAIHFGEGWDKVERDTIEKRLTIAFTLLSLAHVVTPDGKSLYPGLLDRIPLVVGQYDFALACELFPARILRMNERVLEQIAIDREGFSVPDKDGALIRNKAFINYYEDELQRIRFLQQDIFKAKIRLADMKDQKDRYEKLLAERTKQRADVLEKIAAARAKTAKDVAELRHFQNDLFRHQLELATSEERLAEVNREIQEKLGKRGATAP